MAKLPVWRTIGAAYGFVFGAPFRLWRAAGFWFLILVLAAGWGWLSPLPRSAVELWTAVAQGAVLGLVIAVGSISFAVAWHRAVLLAENRAWFSAFRFRRREWRFLGNLLLIGLLVGVPLFIAFSFFGVLLFAAVRESRALIGWLPWFFVIGLLLLLPAWFVWARLGLAFPAIAIDQRDALSRGWRLGYGNWLRLFLGSVLCYAPVIAADLLLARFFGIEMTMRARYQLASGVIVTLSKGQPLREAIHGVIDILVLAVVVAYYSYAYRSLSSLEASDAAPQALPAE